MLADIFDVLTLANWQRGGAKAKHKPERYPRPGDEPKTNRLELAEVSAGLDRLERKRRMARLRAQGVSDA